MQKPTDRLDMELSVAMTAELRDLNIKVIDPDLKSREIINKMKVSLQIILQMLKVIALNL